MNYNDILFTLCNMNDLDMVKHLLSRYIETIDTLDVLQGDGILFQASLSRNNTEICAALLDFFENKQNPSDEAKERLKDILEEATSFADVSPQMQKVLKNYIPIDDTRLSDVTSIDLDTIVDNHLEHEAIEPRNSSISSDDSHIFIITEANLRKWNSEHHLNDELIGIQITHNDEL